MAQALDYSVNPARPMPPEQVPREGHQAWLDLQDPSDADLERLAGRFGLSRNTLLACLKASTGAASLDGAFYLGLRVPGQGWLAVVLRDQLLLTVHRGEQRAVNELRELLLDPRRGNRAPQANASYPAALLLERLLGETRERLDLLSVKVEQLEERALRGSKEDLATRTVALQREFLGAERALHSVARAASDLEGSESDDVHPFAAAVLRRVVAQAEDLLQHSEMSRDMVTNILNVHISVVSMELNDVMRILTVVATIILLPTLVVGFWGMNFPGLTGLHEDWGYPLALVLMAGSVLGSYAWFRHRGWVGPRSRGAGVDETH